MFLFWQVYHNIRELEEIIPMIVLGYWAFRFHSWVIFIIVHKSKVPLMILNYLESFISNFINLHSIVQRIIIIKFHKIKTRRCVLSISNEKQRSEQRWSLRVSCFTYFRDVLALQYTTYLLYRELWKMLLHP